MFYVLLPVLQLWWNSHGLLWWVSWILMDTYCTGCYWFCFYTGFFGIWFLDDHNFAYDFWIFLCYIAVSLFGFSFLSFWGGGRERVRTMWCLVSWFVHLMYSQEMSWCWRLGDWFSGRIDPWYSMGCLQQLGTGIQQ